MSFFDLLNKSILYSGITNSSADKIFISKVYLLKAVFSHGNWPILFIIVLTSFLALGYAWQMIENIWMKQPGDTALTINDDPKIYIPLVVLAVFNILFGICVLVVDEHISLDQLDKSTGSLFGFFNSISKSRVSL